MIVNEQSPPGVKIYLIVKWSAQNRPRYYLGQLVKHHTDMKFSGRNDILSGTILSDGSPIVVSDLSLSDVTNFITDIDNITEEEKECLRMNYPDLHIRFPEN